MRDEDLKGIPQLMTRAARDALLAACGITELDNLREFSMDYRGITAVVYATDETGRRLLTRRPTEIDVQDLGEKEPQKVPGPWESEPAMHTIYIPFVG